MAQDPDNVYKFNVGDNILCYYGPIPYEAKCMYRRKPEEYEAEYYVHYKGWKRSYDEWVVESFIVEANEENLTLMAALKSQHLKNNPKRNKYKRISSVKKQVEKKKPGRKPINVSSIIQRDDRITKYLTINDIRKLLKEKRLIMNPQEENINDIPSVKKQVKKKKQDQNHKSINFIIKKNVNKIDYTLLPITDIKLNKLIEEKRTVTVLNRVLIRKKNIEENNPAEKRKQRTLNSFEKPKHRKQDPNEKIGVFFDPAKEIELNSSNCHNRNVTPLSDPKDGMADIITVDSDEETDGTDINSNYKSVVIDLTLDNDVRDVIDLTLDDNLD